MSVTNRPIIISSVDDTVINTSSSLLYNFGDKIGDEFNVSSIDDSEEMIKGINFAANPQKEDTVIRFNGTDYLFHSFILSKDIDDDQDAGNYGMIIKLYSLNFTERLYIQFPLVIGKKSDVDKFVKAIDKDDTRTLDNGTGVDLMTIKKINPNKWFPIDTTYQFYTFKQNYTFVVISDALTIKSDSISILDTKFPNTFGSPRIKLSNPNGSIFDSVTAAKQMDFQDMKFQDIYIDCSPEDNNNNDRIIRPKKVFNIKPLFGFGTGSSKGGGSSSTSVSTSVISGSTSTSGTTTTSGTTSDTTSTSETTSTSGTTSGTTSETTSGSSGGGGGNNDGIFDSDQIKKTSEQVGIFLAGLLVLVIIFFIMKKGRSIFSEGSGMLNAFGKSGSSASADTNADDALNNSANKVINGNHESAIKILTKLVSSNKSSSTRDNMTPTQKDKFTKFKEEIQQLIGRIRNTKNPLEKDNLVEQIRELKQKIPSFYGIENSVAKRNTYKNLSNIIMILIAFLSICILMKDESLQTYDKVLGGIRLHIPLVYLIVVLFFLLCGLIFVGAESPMFGRMWVWMEEGMKRSKNVKPTKTIHYLTLFLLGAKNIALLVYYFIFMPLYFFRQWEIFKNDIPDGMKKTLFVFGVILGVLIIYGVVFSIAYLVLFLTGSRLVEEGRRLAPIAVFSLFITLLIILNAFIRIFNSPKISDKPSINNETAKQAAAAYSLNKVQEKIMKDAEEIKKQTEKAAMRDKEIKAMKMGEEYIKGNMRKYRDKKRGT